MKLKLAGKLGLGFASVLVLMALSFVLATFKLAEVKQTTGQLLDIRIPQVSLTKNLQRDMQYSASKLRQCLLAGSDKTREEAAQKAWNNAWSAIDKDVADLVELSPKFTSQANKDRVSRAKERLPQLKEVQAKSIAMATSGARDAVIAAGNYYADVGTPLNDSIAAAIGELADSAGSLLKQDQDDMLAANQSVRLTMGVTTGLAILIGVVLAIVISKRISSLTSALLQQAESIAAGDLTREAVQVTSRDELGDLAGAINRMHESLRNVIQSIAENARRVAKASEHFSSVSQQISANSEETSAQVASVSAATEEVNRNLQTVATATEEMSASIQEIAKNSTEAAKVATEAMKTASETNAIVSKLGESSAEIGQVIKAITAIAQKTDLLALNATVEAARAGDVGAGFAVVANEVKELAKQTATATEDISTKIAKIQEDARGAVDAIKRITGIIDQVSAISSTIATAVEEQSATTSEMSRNLTEAAKGSGEVAQNINGVAQAAQDTSRGATDSQKAARGLAEMSAQLQELVSQFKVDSRDAGRGSRRGGSSAATAARPEKRSAPEEALVH